MSPKGPGISKNNAMLRIGSFVIVGAMSAGLLAGCGRKGSGCRRRQAAYFHFIDAGGRCARQGKCD